MNIIFGLERMSYMLLVTLISINKFMLVDVVSCLLMNYLVTIFNIKKQDNIYILLIHQINVLTIKMK